MKWQKGFLLKITQPHDCLPFSVNRTACLPSGDSRLGVHAGIWNLGTSDWNKAVRDCWEVSVFAVTPGHRPRRLLFQWVVRNEDKPLVPMARRREILLPGCFPSVPGLPIALPCPSDACILAEASERPFELFFPAIFARPTLKRNMQLNIHF